MRRFFSTSLIALALVVGAAGAAPAAHAAVCSASTVGQSCALDGGSAGVCKQNPEDGSYGCGPVITNATPGTYAAQAADAQAGTKQPNTAGANQPIDSNLGKTTEEGFGKMMTFIMSLFAWLVGVAAITLDYAVFYTVVKMGDYIKDLSAVGVTWSILRDIGNIIIIFGFLAIGITTIIDKGDWYGGGKKMLPMLLVSAVFLNFSLFLTGAVIDTSNLFATQFYTQIKGGQLPTAKSLNETTSLDAVEKEGISNKIMGQLGLQTIYGQARNPNTKIFEGASSWYIGFMGIILFIVTAFVMFSLAFILIARFVILLFLIIISPIGFAGLAVPQLKNMASEWWGKLFKQAITAPVLLLLLYIALRVITDERFLTGFGSGSAGPDWLGYVGVKNLAGFGSTILSFLIAMGLLSAVVIMSKRLSAFGGAGATKLAGKLTFGLTAAGMRSTAGWGLNSAARRFRSAKIGGVRLATIPVFGRSVAGALDRGAKASFDVRGATIGGGLKGFGVEAGEAQKGGYTQQLKEAIEGREKYAATLEMSKGEKEQVAAEKTLTENLEKLGETIKAQNEDEMKTIRAKHAADLKPFNDDVDTKRGALKAAEASGVGVDRAQLALNNALITSQQKRDDQNKEREAKKQEHDKKITENTQKINESKTRVANLSKAPQLEYAKNIQRGPGKFLYRNTKAADNIIKSAGKSKEQKDVEKMMELAKKYAAAETGAAPAPAATPPPGGAPNP